METDVAGLVQRLQVDKRKWSNAVVEAVVNSIQSIEDKKGLVKGDYEGYIQIRISRDSAQGSLSDDIQGSLQPTAVTIVDNGIGLDDEHFSAFSKAHTSYRSGGRGVGRFFYLKYFNKCELFSVHEQGGRLYEATHCFTISRDVERGPDYPSSQLSTGVTLHMMDTQGKSLAPIRAATLIRHLADHCIVPYIKGTLPRITIEDSAEEAPILFNAILAQEFGRDVEVLRTTVNDHEFRLHLRKQYDGKAVHEIKLCAADRVVTTKALSQQPGFMGPFEDQGGPFKVKVYAEGSILDETVDDTRSRFHLADESEETTGFLGVPSERTITEALIEVLRGHYQKETTASTTLHINEATRRILNSAPEYGHLVHNGGHPSLSSIRLDGDDISFKQELVRLNAKWEHDHIERVRSVLPKDVSADNLEEYIKHVREFYEDEGAYAKSRLAQYIYHRKIILSMVEAFIRYGRRGDANHAVLEQHMHSLIIPMGITNLDNSQEFQSNNLWLLDEKLTTYQYINSDKRLDKSVGAAANSGREPDVSGFSYRFADEAQMGRASGVVIVELKRPGVGYVTNNRNEKPEEQVKNYIKEIVKNSIAAEGTLDKLTVTEHTPKYAYILCDYDPQQEVDLVTYDGFMRSVDQTLYKNVASSNLLITVLRYSEFLDLARTRNRILFEKLGIDGKDVTWESAPEP